MVLGIGNVSSAVNTLDDDEKNTIVIIDSIPGNPNKTIINEPGLYSLILRSRKSQAKAFKRWITNEVFPLIRDAAARSAPNKSDKIKAVDSDASNDLNMTLYQLSELVFSTHIDSLQKKGLRRSPADTPIIDGLSGPAARKPSTSFAIGIDIANTG